MSFHLTSGIHKIALHLCFYFLRKKCKSRESIMSPFLTPDIRTTITCSLEEIFRGRSSFLINVVAAEQAAICLDSNSHTSKAARPLPLTVIVPKKPSRSEVATSDQRDSGKHTRRRTAFLHFGVSRKRFSLWSERQLTNISDRSVSPLPSSFILYVRSVRFFKTILTPKNWVTWNKIIGSNWSAPPSNLSRWRNPVTMADILLHGHHNGWHIIPIRLPNNQNSTPFSPPFLSPSDEEEKRIHGDSTRQ